MLEGLLLDKFNVPTIAARHSGRAELPSSSDCIRRGIPLVSTGAHFQKHDLVGTPGLDGALAPLGLGGLVATLEKTIDGPPIVGGAVGGLVQTVDSTVEISSLLDPVAVAAAKPSREKRQTPDLSGLLPGLQAGIPLRSLTGALPLGSVTGALGGVTDALPVAGVTSAGSLLGQLAQLEGLASYLPSLASVAPSYASHLNAADTQVPSAATSPSLAQLEALLGQLEGSTGTAASVPAAPAAVPNPLSSLSIAEAEAYGLLPAGYLSNLNANVPAAIGNEFLVPATEFHRGKNETSTGEIPWGRNSSVPLGASGVSKSKAPQSTTVGHKDLEMSSSTATETATATTTASTTTSLDLGGPSSTSSMVLTADVPAYTGGAGSNDELLIGAFDDASTSSDNGTVESQ